LCVIGNQTKKTTRVESGRERGTGSLFTSSLGKKSPGPKKKKKEGGIGEGFERSYFLKRGGGGEDGVDMRITSFWGKERREERQ